MKRMVILGSSCAGKTTFAKALSARLGVPHVELDALFWEPGWQEASREVFRERVRSAISGDGWIVDGNYVSKLEDLVWDQADRLIWLDPPLLTILRRFFWRSFSRSFRREVLWSGCRESLSNSIFSRNSLLVWILSSHRAKRHEYLTLSRLQGPRLVRLRSDREAMMWIEAF